MLMKTDAPQLHTPSDIPQKDVKSIVEALNPIVADLIALQLKTRNFHWHMSGAHFRDYHLLLDEQAEQIYAAIDPVAERVRKLGYRTITSVGAVSKMTRISDNDQVFVEPSEMLAELMEDNKNCAAAMRAAHTICDDAKDNGTAGLLETLIDQTERRVWFLFEASQTGERSRR